MKSAPLKSCGTVGPERGGRIIGQAIPKVGAAREVDVAAEGQVTALPSPSQSASSRALWGVGTGFGPWVTGGG